MSIKVTYADWLANYSPRQYKENTIRTYVSALEKAPGRLGITLEKPIIEHLSTKEFDAFGGQSNGNDCGSRLGSV